MTSLSASRKLCYKCHSTSHLAHACKKTKVEYVPYSMHDPINMIGSHLPCGKIGCMKCMFNMLNYCFTTMNTCFTGNTNSNDNMRKPGKAKTASPPKVRMETQSSKPKDIHVKAKKSSVKVVSKNVKKEPIVTPVGTSNPLGPKEVWVPENA